MGRKASRLTEQRLVLIEAVRTSPTLMIAHVRFIASPSAD